MLAEPPRGFVDLVAHVGQELALGAVGGLGRMGGLEQLFLCSLAVADVDQGPIDSAARWGLRGGRAPSVRGDPAPAPIPLAHAKLAHAGGTGARPVTFFSNNGRSSSRTSRPQQPNAWISSVE
jgi:hypothetical protein